MFRINAEDMTSGGGITLSGEYTTDSNTGLLMHFNEGCGAPEDSSVKNNNGTINGGASRTKEGKDGSALEFDGEDDFMTFHGGFPHEFIDKNNELTISLWVKPNSYLDSKEGYSESLLYSKFYILK
mgnify:CR=1 FL=1